MLASRPQPEDAAGLEATVGGVPRAAAGWSRIAYRAGSKARLSRRFR